MSAFIEQTKIPAGKLALLCSGRVSFPNCVGYFLSIANSGCINIYPAPLYNDKVHGKNFIIEKLREPTDPIESEFLRFYMGDEDIVNTETLLRHPYSFATQKKFTDFANKVYAEECDMDAAAYSKRQRQELASKILAVIGIVLFFLAFFKQQDESLLHAILDGIKVAFFPLMYAFFFLNWSSNVNTFVGESAEERESAKEMQKFLRSSSTADFDKCLRDNPLFFTDYLPYAMFSFYDVEYMEKFNGLDITAPAWWRGDTFSLDYAKALCNTLRCIPRRKNDEYNY